MFTRYQILQPKRVCLYSFFFSCPRSYCTQSRNITCHWWQLWLYWCSLRSGVFLFPPIVVVLIKNSEEEQVLLGCILFFFLLGFDGSQNCSHLPVEVITSALVSVVALPRCWRKLHWIGRLMVRASCCPWLAFWRCWRFWLRCTVWSMER